MARDFLHDVPPMRALTSPWLQTRRLSLSEVPWVEFTLPEPGGVTFGALWKHCGDEVKPLLLVRLLSTLAQVEGSFMLPRSAVLCDARGGMHLVPQLTTAVEGAAKTWDEYQFDEYCLGAGFTSMTQNLAVAAARLSVLRMNQLYFPEATFPKLSSRFPSLGPLDALIESGLARFGRNPLEPQHEVREWKTTLAVLGDALEGNVGSLAQQVTALWPMAHEEERWT